MEAKDYIQLQTLLAKLEVAILQEYQNENMSEWWSERLTNLQKGIKTIRENIFFKINVKGEEK